MLSLVPYDEREAPRAPPGATITSRPMRHDERETPREPPGPTISKRSRALMGSIIATSGVTIALRPENEIRRSGAISVSEMGQGFVRRPRNAVGRTWMMELGWRTRRRCVRWDPKSGEIE